ncbi:WD40-repeat-containing domain protein [Chytriomyces sp. MP71]|nr:WD40-repeat-containing domain protein [Chytriomyces sp. MP71]
MSGHPEDMDRIVAAYLRERGYRNAESALAQDSRMSTNQRARVPRATSADSDDDDEANGPRGGGFGGGAVEEASIPDFILFYSEAEANNPNAYEHSLGRLVKWVKDSLEKYRAELSTVLFPLFTHAYLDLISRSMHEQARHLMDTHRKDHLDAHSADIARLASISNADQLKNNELAQQFLSNRYTVRMSRYAFELLLSFLQDNKFMLLTRLLNRHVTIRVDNEKPGGVAAEEGVGLSSLTPAQMSEHNSQPVQLGKLPADPWMVNELEFFLRDEKIDAEPLRGELRNLIKREAGEDAPARDNVPLPPPKFADVRKEIQELKDVRDRLQKSSASVPAPSICCYTFHNTYDTMTCLTTSSDHSLVLAGFSESFLKVWSLKGEKLHGLKQNASKEIVRETTGSESKRLVGHSGPVYGARISNDRRFAISCSEDATVRFWSLDTYTNLAVYKGHNYPVWDVDLASNDIYFATSSFDRTARLWRTDMINPLRMFVGHESDVDCVKFHPNSNYVATGGGDGEVRLWNVQKGNTVRILRAHTASVMALAFSQDGTMLASAGEDKTVKLWDLGSGKLLKSLVGHADTVYSLAFNNFDNQLASAGADNSVIVWNPKGGDSAGEVIKAEGVSAGPAGARAKVQATSPELVGRFYTKKTPIFKVEYTKSNVVLAFGPFVGA